MTVDVVVLVTGASGFVGRELCADLLKRGSKVRALVRDPATAPQGTTPCVAAGLDDARAIDRAVTGVSAVVHLAGRAHVMRESADNPDEAFRVVNVDGTRRVLDASRAAGVPKFLFASSVKAVGEANDRPWTESTVPAPEDAYGRSKLAAEEVVRSAGRDGMHAPILRLPLVYGPGVKGNLLRLLEALDAGRPLPFGSIRNRRSLVAMPNLLAAIHAVLAVPGAGNGTFFVSDDHDVSSAELCRFLAAGLGRRARLLPVPSQLLAVLGRIGDGIRPVIPVPFDSASVRRLTGSLTVSVDALKQNTGWVPVVSPELALAETGAWYRQSRAGS